MPAGQLDGRGPAAAAARRRAGARVVERLELASGSPASSVRPPPPRGRGPAAGAGRRLVGDGVAGAGAEQGGTERRRRADHVEAAGALLDVADEVALGVVVASPS